MVHRPDIIQAMKDQKSILKYLILAGLTFLFTKLVWPFLASVIIAIFFAVVFSPAHRFFKKKLKIGESFSAILVVLLTFIFILAPLVLFFGLVAKEAFIFVNSIDSQLALDFVSKYSQFQIFGYEIDLNKFQEQIQSLLQNAGKQILDFAKAFGANVANFTFQFFVFFLLYFYFLRDGKNFLIKVKEILPFTKGQNKILLEEFRTVTKTVFVGNLVGAVLAGVTAYIGFAIFGLKAPLIWALLAGLLSLLPSIGTLLVYIAGIIIAFYSGGWYAAGGLLAYFIVAEMIIVQNLIKPKFLDDKISMHPVLVFFSLVGGVEAFGSIGIIYGPLIVVAFVSIFEFLLITRKQ